jgi:uncharacterized protein (DUF2062 family)
MHAMFNWCLSLGKPLAIGLVALAVTLGIVGTLATRFAWRLYVILAWKKRAASRRAGRP